MIGVKIFIGYLLVYTLKRKYSPFVLLLTDGAVGSPCPTNWRCNDRHAHCMQLNMDSHPVCKCNYGYKPDSAGGCSKDTGIFFIFLEKFSFKKNVSVAT